MMMMMVIMRRGSDLSQNLRISWVGRDAQGWAKSNSCPFPGGCDFSLVPVHGEVTSLGSELSRAGGDMKNNGVFVGVVRPSYNLNQNEPKFSLNSPTSCSTWFPPSRQACLLSSAGFPPNPEGNRAPFPRSSGTPGTIPSIIWDHAHIAISHPWSCGISRVIQDSSQKGWEGFRAIRVVECGVPPVLEIRKT